MKQNLAETRSIGDAFFIVQSFRALERVRSLPTMAFVFSFGLPRVLNTERAYVVNWYFTVFGGGRGGAKRLQQQEREAPAAQI